MTKNQFRGVIGGVEYTDRGAFEKAARDAGHRLGNNRTGDWRVGLPVRIKFDDGAVVEGQVWAKGDEPRCGWVWVALDSGRFARVYTDTGKAQEFDARGHATPNRFGDKQLADKTRRRIAAGIARYWHPVHLEAGGHTYDAADPKHLNYDDPNGYYRAWSAYDVLKTLHTIESKALAIPVEGRDGKEARPMGDPLRTLTTRAETAMVSPFIAELRGGGSTARSVDDAMCTVTAAGNHHGLVTPYYGASQTARPTTDAIGALTTVDRYALVMRNNGGGAEMSTPASEVLRTLTTAGHQSVLTPGDLAAAEAQVDDCLFRMLEPHEVAAGMAFPGDYIWNGTRRERVRMAGNAVTPPAARDLIACVAESLS